jgi:membrane associated rhomboid family serine protease
MAYYRTPYRPDIGLGGRITPGVKWLIIANVSVFVLQLMTRWVGGGGIEPYFGLTPRIVIGNFWIWQLFTYMFLHSTGWLSHLLLNMLMLWMFGSEVERVWGTRPFLRYYFVCGVGGGLTTCLTFPGSTTIGASGAIFGVMLAYGMLFPSRQILLWFIFPMRAIVFVLLCAGIEIFSLLGLPDGIAHTAHLGGMLFGFLYLKRAWRVREFVNEIRWRLRRRRFRVMDRENRRYPFH